MADDKKMYQYVWRDKESRRIVYLENHLHDPVALDTDELDGALTDHLVEEVAPGVPGDAEDEIKAIRELASDSFELCALVPVTGKLRDQIFETAHLAAIAFLQDALDEDDLKTRVYEPEKNAGPGSGAPVEPIWRG